MKNSKIEAVEVEAVEVEAVDMEEGEVEEAKKRPTVIKGELTIEGELLIGVYRSAYGAGTRFADDVFGAVPTKKGAAKLKADFLKKLRVKYSVKIVKSKTVCASGENAYAYNQIAKALSNGIDKRFPKKTLETTGKTTGETEDKTEDKTTDKTTDKTEETRSARELIVKAAQRVAKDSSLTGKEALQLFKLQLIGLGMSVK